MKKLFIASSVAYLAMTGLLAQAADQAVIDRYSKTCAVCHAAGAAGAPRTGDAAQWAPRMEKGMDTLVTSVDKGMNAMPPKGMCFDCSPEEFKALIEYMVEAK
ncbi:c-type cytochrome [Oceanicoccus sagamiensis]|uniref:Cytochrome c5 family protein n=1 Tax=Oceanicoccus sagamiensis TaxID=716816 RepID=A0A1X9NAJ1_9GAMM|nr:c-type cytochrome [Oceanicoccus sagamiensis]ARN74074.1 cytochrome c5 family protein [Oceanicoccus sagamiensis]